MRRQLAEGVDGVEDSGPELSGPGSHAFAVSWSHDGGESWSAIAHQPQLVTPVCQVRIAHYLWPAMSFGGLLLSVAGWVGCYPGLDHQLQGPARLSTCALLFLALLHDPPPERHNPRCALRLAALSFSSANHAARQLLTTERSSPAL